MFSKNKSGIGRRMAIVLASIAMVGGVQAFSAPITRAAAPTSSCSWGDVFYEMGAQSRPINITHEKKISLAPHTSYSKSTSLTFTFQFSVKITGSVSGTVEANTIIAKAGVTAGLSIELMGQATASGTFTDVFSATNPYSSQRHYIFYEGVRELTGTWTKWQCDRFENWFKVTSGTYGTYWDEPQGVVMCEATTGLDSLDKLAKSKYC